MVEKIRRIYILHQPHEGRVAAQGAHVLLAEGQAVKDVAQVAAHDRRLADGPEIARAFQRAFQVVEEGYNHLARRGGRALDQIERRRRRPGRLHPFVGDEQHRLGQVERGVGGVDGEGDDGVGQRHLVVVEPRALRPEQDRVRLAGAGGGLPHGTVRRLHPLVLPALARRRGPHELAVGHRRLQGVEHGCGVEQVQRTGGGGLGRLTVRADPRPTAPRCHETEVRQAEVGHGARAHADVHGELRAHEDDRGTTGTIGLGAVGAGARHARESADETPRRRRRRNGDASKSLIPFRRVI